MRRSAVALAPDLLAGDSCWRSRVAETRDPEGRADGFRLTGDGGAWAMDTALAGEVEVRVDLVLPERGNLRVVEWAARAQLPGPPAADQAPGRRGAAALAVPVTRS